jgi:outer membrane protein OmpA-like peptidoglycan-associated protein
VEVQIQVVSMDPSTASANRATVARLYGSGFKAGATVTIGGSAGEKVQVADANTVAFQVPAMAKGVYDVTVTNPSGESSTLRSGLTVKSDLSACKFVRVQFDYDSAGLTGETKSTLDGKMACYQEAGGAIKIEGHADERGTTDYNLALGQRRADGVERFLTASGISSSRVNSLSYGEERPLERGVGESVWSKNRRAEIHASE